ncbi:MAG: signal peptidase I [Candidatus Aenigmatarchaeota archaeon]
MKFGDIKKSWDSLTDGWFGNIVYIVLGFIIAYSINVGLGFALGTQTPVVDVVSCSMFPFYDRGDMLLVAGDNTPQVGDVIIYDVPGYNYPIIHRVIKINDDGTYQTQGDHNSGQLPFEKNIQSSQIKGKALFKMPYIGWIKLVPMKIFGAIDQPLELCK